MAPARQASSRAAGPTTRGGQSTLSFGNRSKVTKPTPAPSNKTKKDPALFEDRNVTAIASPDLAEPTSAEVAIIDQAKAEAEKPRTEEEEEAENITEAQLRKYWRERENERKASRGEIILAHMSRTSLTKFAVTQFISRIYRLMKRYYDILIFLHNTEKLNLHPPIEVLAILMKEQKADNTKFQRAYIDELMSSRFVEN
ncbi:MAG: hypothetical protein M1819_001459 [Sarea resinae]|nr:MAG: hypothetical protein M1819_001459 [Sarea resinae]